MQSLICLLLCVVAAAVASPATSAERVPPGGWSTALHADINAIDTWVTRHYAGYIDPLYPDLKTRWQAAVSLAHERSRQATGPNDWLNILNALVRSARDDHVTFHVTAPIVDHFGWAQLALERRNGRNLVRRTAQTPADLYPGLEDRSELVGCDGKSADDVLRERLDLWETNWHDEPNRIARASNVFVDTQIRFIAPLRRCEARTPSGAVVAFDLAWTATPIATIRNALAPYRRVMAGQASTLSLRFGTNGDAWLTLGNLRDGPGHRTLKAQVTREKARILKAPYVVIDLRGNGGGNTAFGYGLIEAIWGGRFLIPGGEGHGRGKVWRVNQYNADLIRQVRKTLDPNTERDKTQFLDAMMPLMEHHGGTDELRAIPSQRRTFGRGDAPATQIPRIPQPVFVLTDPGCFSSCILVVDALRRVGAVQVGDPTGRNANYGEVWFSRELPSGFGMLSLPIAAFDMPDRERGGHPPDLTYPDSVVDQESLSRWLAMQVRY